MRAGGGWRGRDREDDNDPPHEADEQGCDDKELSEDTPIPPAPLPLVELLQLLLLMMLLGPLVEVLRLLLLLRSPEIKSIVVVTDGH